MKSIFPLLLIYVLMTSQTFALSGGPVFGSGSSVVVTGIYSGIIQGISETSGSASAPAIPGDPLPPVDTTATTASNAIGLFDLTVPAVSFATGTFLLFADGRVFTGTIDASADPDSGTLKGLLQGTFAFSISSTTTDATGATTVNTIQVTADATGNFNANIRTNRSLFSATLARLTGTADMSINFGQVDASTFAPIIAKTISFDVIGFKQQNLTTS